MKLTLIFLLAHLSLSAFSQTLDNNAKAVSSSDSVTFITKFDIANATKDGFYLREYVVNIDYEEAKKLNGKTITVSGKVTIVKGLKNSPKQYGKDGQEVARQGRELDTRYIKFPVIEVIGNKK